MKNKWKTFIVTHHISIIIIIVLSTIIVLGTLFFVKQLEKIAQNQKDIVEYNTQMGSLFITLQEHITSNDLEAQKKIMFIVNAASIITEHYVKHPNPSLKKLQDHEVILVCETIYSVSKEMNIDPFIALAFASVETDFYYTALGTSGEKSMFQFMDNSARETLRLMGKQYTPNWWLDHKLTVEAFFSYYYRVSQNFPTDDEETKIRWSALAYNAGLHRNEMVQWFERGITIEEYLRKFPLKYGSSKYNKDVYDTYVKYKNFRSKS